MSRRELSINIEISFIESPAVHDMSGNEFKLYVWLWAKAVEQRKEDLNKLSSVYIGRHTGLAANHIEGYLEHLATITPEKPLLVYSKSTASAKHVPTMFNVSVLHVSRKHPRLKDIKETDVFDYGLNEMKLKEIKLKPPQESPPKKPKKIDPRIREFIDWYFDRHQEIIGSKLHVDGNADGAMVKKMLGTFEPDELKTRAEKFLKDKNSFPNNDKSIKYFKVNVNRYGGKKPTDMRGGADHDQFL